jgi:hypothetical protein
VSTLSFFPYAHANGAIECSWRLSGAEFERTPSGHLRLAEDLSLGRALHLSVEARVAPAAFSVVFPEDERTHPPARLLLVVRSASSRLRRGVDLTRVDTDKYVGETDLRCSDISGFLEASVFLIRSAARGSTRSFATHTGAILAESPSLVIELEEPRFPPGGHLDVAFENFATSTNPVRRAHPRQLFAIDTEGDAPKIWLNEGVRQLAAVLTTRARRGSIRRVRDATYETIVTQAWTSLIGTAFGNLAVALGHDVEYQEALESLEEWQRSTLTFWAPKLYPGLDDSEAMQTVCRAAQAREGHGAFFERVTLSVQEWADSANVFDGLLRWINGDPA